MENIHMNALRKLKPVLLSALIALLFTPSFAVSAENKTLFFYVNYDLVVAADGSIERLQAKDKNLKPALTQMLEKSVRSWKFTPGNAGGAPQRTETTLSLNVQATSLNGESYELAIIDATTGLIGSHGLKPPQYPANSLLLGHEAVLRLRLDYDANGVVTKVDYEPGLLSPRDQKLMMPFVKAGLKAAKDWRFYPEKVGDTGIPGTVIVPVSFCTDKGKCSAFLKGSKEKEELARQLESKILLSSSQVGIERPRG
jgi:hypothetical protein